MTTNTTNGSISSKIKIASTGAVFDVPDDKSILLVLIENGYLVESSCTAGLCGMCRVRYLEGEVEHKDIVLTDQEKSEYLTTCISRPLSSQIVLDLPPPGTAQSETIGVVGIMDACPKLLMNGPCGGSERGMCEVDISLPCVWAKSWENSEALGIMDMLMEVQPPRDWSLGRRGGTKLAVDKDASQQSSVDKGGAAKPAKTDTEPVAADSDAGDREDAFLKNLGLT